MVTVLGQEIAVKVAMLQGDSMNIQPEFSDCLKASEKTGVPVKEIIALAASAYRDREK